MPGTNTLAAEVTHVSKHGFWLLLGEEELLLPFSEFPWFRQATIEQICAVEWPSPDHVYWPQLDIDLFAESIRHPERFPLMSKATANTGSRGRAESGAPPSLNVGRLAASCYTIAH
ncbi:DUF2442 domain-containing protein [Acidithiobacillus sp. M4-SHS-6]|uniref:DUF2442 domain-containing protein n=1 Tax=Acidithiobacillus sp. M4-SHS-6 TaxID=3383024 RepID=UPI0039BE2463